MVAINSRGGHWSYRRDYKQPTDIVKTYHHCNVCQKSWYSSDEYSFLICPICKSYESISTRLDTTGGNMGLQKFPGAKYSKRPNTLQEAITNTNNTRDLTPRAARGLKELNRILSFTGV